LRELRENSLPDILDRKGSLQVDKVPIFEGDKATR